ncbi:MAG: hypothetical protein JWM78_583 [Verrucomicrobiaceae bacterium]|nr:hypothetical protein [Verrucomicrobiaceae bacterium]
MKKGSRRMIQILDQFIELTKLERHFVQQPMGCMKLVIKVVTCWWKKLKEFPSSVSLSTNGLNNCQKIIYLVIGLLSLSISALLIMSVSGQIYAGDSDRNDAAKYFYSDFEPALSSIIYVMELSNSCATRFSAICGKDASPFTDKLHKFYDGVPRFSDVIFSQVEKQKGQKFLTFDSYRESGREAVKQAKLNTLKFEQSFIIRYMAVAEWCGKAETLQELKIIYKDDLNYFWRVNPEALERYQAVASAKKELYKNDFYVFDKSRDCVELLSYADILRNPLFDKIEHSRMDEFSDIYEIQVYIMRLATIFQKILD